MFALFVCRSSALVPHRIPLNQREAPQNPVPSVGGEPTNPHATSITLPKTLQNAKKTTGPPSTFATDETQCAIFQILFRRSAGRMWIKHYVSIPDANSP